MSNDAVARYSEIDFSATGEAALRLLSLAKVEAASPTLRLTDHVGKLPPHLTGEMAAWFGEYVSSDRQAALDCVDVVLTRLDQSKHGKPVFLERERDQAREDLISKKRDTIARSQSKHRAEYEKLENLVRDEDQTRRRFETLRAQHDREPKLLNLLFYISVMLLIGVAEALINWETFNAIKFFTPAIATGTTLVVGSALAISSHLYGTMVRQMKALFDNSVDDMHRHSGWRILVLGTGALSVALGAVAYGRYYFFADVMAEAAVLGGEPPNALRIIGGSMLTNLLVWMVGVLIAYMVHDPDPRFPDSLKELRRAEAARESLAYNLEKPLRRDFEQLDAIHKKLQSEMTQRNASLSSTPVQKEIRELLTSIMKQDAKVIAILLRYRQALIALIPHDKPAFQVADELQSSKSVQLSPQSYAATELKMKYV